jgi:hypothetical protein
VPDAIVRQQLLSGAVLPLVEWLTDTVDALLRGTAGADPAGMRVLPLIDIWSQLHARKRDFDEILLVRALLCLRSFRQQDLEGGTMSADLAQSTAALATVCKRFLAEFEEGLRREWKGAEVPEDGTVHQLSVQTLNFLKRMVDYRGLLDQLTSGADYVRKHIVLLLQSRRF